MYVCACARVYVCALHEESIAKAFMMFVPFLSIPRPIPLISIGLIRSLSIPKEGKSTHTQHAHIARVPPKPKHRR